MEIKVGEYVRSHLGGIGKVTRIENNSNTQFLYEDKTLITIDRNVVKHSTNIIDLIEVGDYVNGFQVFKTNKQSYLDYAVMVIDGAEDGTYVFKDEIKSIVTKELFKDMEYKV